MTLFFPSSFWYFFPLLLFCHPLAPLCSSFVTKQKQKKKRGKGKRQKKRGKSGKDRRESCFFLLCFFSDCLCSVRICYDSFIDTNLPCLLFSTAFVGRAQNSFVTVCFLFLPHLSVKCSSLLMTRFVSLSDVSGEKTRRAHQEQENINILLHKQVRMRNIHPWSWQHKNTAGSFLTTATQLEADRQSGPS